MRVLFIFANFKSKPPMLDFLKRIVVKLIEEQKKWPKVTVMQREKLRKVCSVFVMLFLGVNAQKSRTESVSLCYLCTAYKKKRK